MAQMQEMMETDLGFVIADLNNRVRSLEGKYNLFGERLLVVNQNMIEEYKKIIKEMKLIGGDVQDLKKEMFKIRVVMKNVIKEMESYAKKDQMKVLEKYIDLWSPLHFVTREELNERMIAEAEEKKRSKKHAR